MQYFKLEITIDRDGNITEKVIAGSGSDCTKITEELNQAIGNAELSEFLPEYFLEDTTNYSQPICQSGNL